MRPGTLADAGLVLVFVAVLVLAALAIEDTWGAGYWQFDCAAGAVVCVIALARGRDRVWAAAAGLAVAAVAVLATRFVHLPAEPGPAMILALAVLVGSAIRALPVPQAAAVAAAGLAVVAGAWLSAPPLSSGTVPRMTVAGWLAALTIGLSLRSLDARRRATTEKVRRDERLELARELHDVVAHHITGIVVQAQAARLVARRRPDTLDDCLADIESAGSGALAAMRRVVGILRDDGDAASTTPGPEQLGDLVERFSGHGPEVRLRLPGGESAWPPEVAGTVYRVVQESLTNVVRHARHAKSVTVSVAQDRRAVTVEVVDDAAPAPVRHHHRGGYGLVGMRERVEVLGGTLHAGPRPGAGWSVLATLPVPVAEPR
ncbi:histidine kinase [Planotetraspora kaengkrachanensis]|uniref:histidine kinase n=1 Tax=Planotetraspora kaengkrachanensis TaxID=575193 RepID=A0A8J3PZP3_9ACTN|nr:two-component sensor histidine kinase [Planotetraspora kaengkrachanensis]